jgi:RimJ/RimL family protein N-acetyltransferase
MSVVIERAVPADAEAILRLKRDGWLETYVNEELGVTREDIDKKLPESTIAEATPRWQEGIAAETEDGDHITFVARQDDTVVGFTAPRIEEGRRRVGGLYVKPGYQGKGIGSELLRKTLAWWGNDEDIYITVVSYNQAAIRFYERHGFVKIGETSPLEYDEVEQVKLLPVIEMVLRAGSKK